MAGETTLFSRYCLTLRQKPLPKSALERPQGGFGFGFGDSGQCAAGRRARLHAWMGLSGRFLALGKCPWRASHAGMSAEVAAGAGSCVSTEDARNHTVTTPDQR